MGEEGRKRGRRWRDGDTGRPIEGEGEGEKRESESRTEAIKERDR
jgi:hypothetical protein